MDASFTYYVFLYVVSCYFKNLSSLNLYAFAQNGLIVPVIDNQASLKANCEHTVRAIQYQAVQNGKLAYEKPTGNSLYLSNKTVANPQFYGTNEDGRIVSAYIPQCRPDRPDLYIARQCNEYDCFCVNVTTGATLLGTRASPAEVGDCSTAIYSVLLALYLRSILPASVVGESRQESSSDTGDISHVPWDSDTALKLHIKNSIEKILRSAVGFQQVISVTRISAIPGVQPHNSSEFAYYQVQLTSTGHSSLQAPQDLLGNRLHEGFLPDVGVVDPRISYVKIIEPKIPDPAPLTSSHEFEDLLLNRQTNLHLSESEITQQSKSSIPSSGHKMVAVRSSEISGNSYLGSHEASSLKSLDPKLSSLSSSENVAHIFGPFEPNVLSGGVSAVRQTSIHSRSLHQSWNSGTSTSKILGQPGVIAGIVGSVVVVLLLLILLILFCIYRLRKKDEGSYALDEPKKLPTVDTYTRAPTREFYA
ncbi:unnamed protein product [Schistosoma turkestanicum]|nr:unnamed protein product [Schistosoma turkestanicum]